MTVAKKRTKELIETLFKVEPRFTLGDGKSNYSMAKQYAKVCAEEILNEYQELKELDMKSTKWDSMIKFWVDVIEEINKA